MADRPSGSLAGQLVRCRGATKHQPSPERATQPCSGPVPSSAPRRARSGGCHPPMPLRLVVESSAREGVFCHVFLLPPPCPRPP
jgi:hypothetical protein